MSGIKGRTALSSAASTGFVGQEAALGALELSLYLRAQGDIGVRHFLSYTIKVCTFPVFYHDKNIKQKFKKKSYLIIQNPAFR